MTQSTPAAPLLTKLRSYVVGVFLEGASVVGTFLILLEVEP